MIAVIPRPTAAGVLGMARTIGVSAPRTLSNAAIGVPAATDTNSVSPPPSAASVGSASPIICGFTAINTMAGASGSDWFRCSPSRPFSQSDGCGSITQTEAAGKPC